MVKLIISTIIMSIVALFFLFNSNQRVALHLIFTQLSDFPLAMACLIFFILGLMVSIPFFLADRLQLIKKSKQESRRLSVHIEALRNEVKELEKKINQSEDMQ